MTAAAPRVSPTAAQESTYVHNAFGLQPPNMGMPGISFLNGLQYAQPGITQQMPQAHQMPFLNGSQGITQQMPQVHLATNGVPTVQQAQQIGQPTVGTQHMFVLAFVEARPNSSHGFMLMHVGRMYIKSYPQPITLDTTLGPRVSSLKISKTMALPDQEIELVEAGVPVIQLYAGESDFDTLTIIAEVAESTIYLSITYIIHSFHCYSF
ncbi:bifunctional aspartate aminotransferase and glutamate/aspartate-prephenate aminotransferase [Artemisia annua]|uniref:Bifunctional aspartate aminotransferase and glutamate/aspartate-prephenate aminotransferase n=1 Tax=Artemisia annua TaxID=35608 RepID=A0A2U1Q2H6_ARTAN|nr:bifunctional aspartate aminotransferase and glutamate/aspartate-prephenate aminotransferase [Artemisia annua]